MTEANNAVETAPSKGEWTRRIADWERRDADFICRFSSEPLREEESQSPKEQEKIILARQMEACLQVMGALAPVEMPRRDEYYPGTKVIKATAALLRDEKIRAELKAELERRKVADSATYVEEAPKAVEAMFSWADQHRWAARMAEAEEAGDTKIAILMGIMALTARKPEARRQVVEEVFTKGADLDSLFPPRQ